MDHELPHLSALERAAEVIRFIFTRLEYALSPGGQLREFFKMNCRVALIIAIPVIMVAPLITVALERLNAWIALLSETMSSFILFPLSVILSVLLFCGLIYIGRAIMEMKMRAMHRRDPYGY